jgi:DNA-binding NarL/FixJ family response regulator
MHEQAGGSAPRAKTIGVDERWEVIAEYEQEGNRYAVIRAKQGMSALPPRERQVLARAALGQTNKVIAYELGISASTVRVFMARACVRLGVRTRAEAIDFFRATLRET